MLLTALVWFYALAVLLVRVARLRPRSPGYRRAPGSVVAFVRFPAKPEWVRQEVIRLKALIPKAGCRAISAIFNRRFAAKRRMTVGKTFVAELVRQHRYEIDVVRRQIKNARPKPVPRNLVWALDLTGKATLDGRTRLVLGILEHASRAALWLEALETKSSWTLIVKLAEAITATASPAPCEPTMKPSSPPGRFASHCSCSASAISAPIPAARGRTAASSASSARSKPSSINLLLN